MPVTLLLDGQGFYQACLDRIVFTARHNDGNRLGRILGRLDQLIPPVTTIISTLRRTSRQQVEGRDRLLLRVLYSMAMFRPSMWPTPAQRQPNCSLARID